MLRISPIDYHPKPKTREASAMYNGSRAAQWFDGVWLFCFGALSTLWCVGAARELGATFDEPFYVEAGLRAWREHTAKPLIDKGTMPLPMYVQLAPVLAWERFRGERVDAATDFAAILPLFRWGNLPFWWLLLAGVLVAGRELGGAWAGRLAVALIALEPTFLAHASLGTADIAAVALLIPFWLCFRAGRDQSWSRRVVAPALLFALTMFAKVSVLPFAALGMLVIELERRAAEWRAANGWLARCRAVVAVLFARSFRRDAVQVVGLMLVFIFVLVGSDWKASPSFVQWAASLPDDLSGRSMRWLAGNLCVFSNAGNAIGYQIRHNIRSHQGAFLLGQSWSKAVWYYFPVALSIKLTLSALALAALVIVAAPRSLRNWAAALAVVCLLFSLNCRVQTGVRFMFPLLAAAAVGVASAVACAIATAGSAWRRRLLATAAVVAPLWAGWSAWAVWPNGLCYTNELWGGTERGYRLLCDSNYDWGQGLPELIAWQAEHGPVDVFYFGTDPLIDAGPHRPVRLGRDFDPRRGIRPEDCRNRKLAVATGLLHSSFDQMPEMRPTLEQLRRLQPVDRTLTFVVFNASDLQQSRPLATAPLATAGNER